MVAKQGFDVLMEGKDKIIAGSFLNKVQGALGKSMPENAAAAMRRRLTEPGLANK